MVPHKAHKNTNETDEAMFVFQTPPQSRLQRTFPFFCATVNVSVNLFNKINYYKQHKNKTWPKVYGHTTITPTCHCFTSHSNAGGINILLEEPPFF